MDKSASIGYKTKAAIERERSRPIRHGAHTLHELAVLVRDGRTIADVAKLWEMRPIAGPGDLWHELNVAWRAAGCPGGIVEPPVSGIPRVERQELWAEWRRRRDEAIMPWLLSFGGVPFRAAHCETCRCYEDD